MIIPALIAGGATLISGLISGISANKAAKTQAAAAQAGIDEQRRQFDAMQEVLAPYVQAGTGAMGGMQNLAGLGGAEAQQAAIAAISNSPEMQAMLQQGENAMLQNAAATGGLRGGNLQGALAQYRPQVLSQLINQQYSRLGGIAQLGQASAAGVGTAGLQTGQSIANLLQQQGAAQAGGQLATGQAWQSIPNAFMSGLGIYAGLNGFNQSPATTTLPTIASQGDNYTPGYVGGGIVLPKW
jgi:hypothetical protein